MSYRTNIHPYILSGGSGKRLWPLSRSLYPKQFVSIKNKNSLFQDTLMRLNDPMYSKPNVICNIEHRFMVRDQAKSIRLNLGSIFLEPVGKNTTSSAIISSTSRLRSTSNAAKTSVSSFPPSSDLRNDLIN